MRNNWFKMFMYSGAHFEDSLEKKKKKVESQTQTKDSFIYTLRVGKTMK